jgi:hypothetical protein
MISGLTTRLSEEAISLTTSINPKSDLVHVTSTTSTTVVATIIPPFAGFSGVMIFVNRSGAAITTVTSGNIQTAISVGQNVATVLTYSKLLGKWVVGALA